MPIGDKIKNQLSRVDAFLKEDKCDSDPVVSAVSILAILRECPAPVQLGVGAASGLVTGYIFTKGSKLAAGLLGISLVLYQFCSHRGYIKINRTCLEGDVERIRETFERHLGLPKQTLPGETIMKKFLKDNQYLLSGFFAGCLLGYGFA